MLKAILVIRSEVPHKESNYCAINTEKPTKLFNFRKTNSRIQSNHLKWVGYGQAIGPNKIPKELFQNTGDTDYSAYARETQTWDNLARLTVQLVGFDGLMGPP